MPSKRNRQRRAAEGALPTTLRAIGYATPDHAIPIDLGLLTHEERHRPVRELTLVHGDTVAIDFPTGAIEDGCLLELDSGRCVEILASDECLYEVRGTDREHLWQLRAYLLTRYTEIQFEDDRLLFPRDPAARKALERREAKVSEVCEPFFPTSPEPAQPT
ncbi:urease accessory protein UreE [Microbacterium sp. NPDC087665]|uniref:urease accessory protein UreE n=1 Tax=Microbacterium sp. NPDC087665 TaxID=3364194 RepID=UPI0038081027